MYLFVGSYTETGSPAPDPKGNGITSCFFDPQNGCIEIIDRQPQRNPSYPIVSDDGRILYAAEEMLASEKPELASYEILEDGRLRKLNAVGLPGDYACHLTIASQTILVANYVSGDILVYLLEEDGKIGPLLQRIRHSGSGSNKSRQEAPHPHMIYRVNDQMVYCIDLGIDEAKAYTFQSSSKKWEPVSTQDIKVNPGAGPRHMDMDLSRECLALIGELSGELFLFRKSKDRFQLVDRSLLGDGEMSAAAIRIHANGHFIYCSERKTNSIHAFGISVNGLGSIGVYSSGGKTPRDISIDPTGKWLLVANHDSDNISIFSIDALTGKLQSVNDFSIPTPSCICWQIQDK
jgi:6-phosphogluconolactonase